uniref:Uncharacterized protein n=1 Tax=viral metagenome TaxID=1070528 RepID=A0A6C0JY87_9ZZZZ
MNNDIEIRKINEYRFNISRSDYDLATINVCIDGIYFNVINKSSGNLSVTDMLMIANKMAYLAQTCWLEALTEKLKPYDYFVEYDPVFEQYNIIHYHDIIVFETSNPTKIVDYIINELKINLNKINI